MTDTMTTHIWPDTPVAQHGDYLFDPPPLDPEEVRRFLAEVREGTSSALVYVTPSEAGDRQPRAS